MKGMKKLLSILMVLTLVLSLGATAFAATTVTTEDDGVYTAYQIFKGSYATIDGAEALGDVEWGDGITPETFVSALKELGEPFNDITVDDPAGVATAIAKVSAEVAVQVADAAFAAKAGSGTSISGEVTLVDGYYLVVDTTGGDDGVYNHALLQLLGGSIEIKKKADGPSFEKKVKDANDTDGTETNWQDSADYDIGDDVPFQLKATTPSKGEGYDKYTMTFHDTLSDGLTFDASSVTITINGTEYTVADFAANGITLTNPALDGCTFDITINNVMQFFTGGDSWLNQQIVVEYNAELNTNAVIGAGGNPNTAKLEFSNNPNEEGTGETPVDTVTVFTFELDIDKVDGDSEPLAGAGFTLYKKDASGTWVEYENALMTKGEHMATENSAGKWVVDYKGLDDGEYKIVETTTPAGYNTAADIEFTVTATHDENSADPKLTDLDVTVTAPVGFDMTADVTTGAINTTVVNNEGPTLPETGGIGTTIFYIAGAVLAAGAVILLVTKKRLSGNAEK